METEVPNVESGPPRKRVRKGTRSCWECKRRKVRCQLSSEDVPVCSGCLARGTTCLSQEYPEEHDPSSTPNVGERLGRVEQLLEKLVAKITAYEEEENAQKIQTPESMGNDVLTPYSSNANSNMKDSVPILSLFDNDVIGRRNNDSQTSTPASQSTGTKTPSCRPSKIDRIRQTLVDLLPPQNIADLIFEKSSCWLIIHSLCQYSKNPLFEDGNLNPQASQIFNMAEVSKLHPIKIAQTILYLVVCLQQLEPGFDTTQLNFLTPVVTRTEKYMATVQSVITSDDEFVSTMDGLACLVLQGMYYINGGQPKRAWLTFRRAMNIAQLMGLNKRESSSPTPGGRELWFQLNRGDRYLSLLLGLPAGSVDDGFGQDETFQNPDVDKDLLFVRKLCDIASRIIERNQAESSHAYATTQEIHEKLENLVKVMPQSWWEIPTYIPLDRSYDAALKFERLMTQIWYYQLEALLHLPFMLRASTERRYDYSKFTCLKASREMIYRYLAIRSVENSSLCCKVVDFAALTATVTLLLGLLEPWPGSETLEMRQQRESDRTLVQTVLHSMEAISQGGRDVVATQSANIIKSLLAVDSPSGRTAGNLRLTIPYFGTINIIRPQRPASTQNVPVAQHQQTISMGQQMPAQAWQGMPFSDQSLMQGPVVSFTSSQFPIPVPEHPPLEDWTLPETDTLYFDSLLNTDIDGNWVF